MQHYSTSIKRLSALHLAAFFQNQLQDVADILVRAEHICLYDRLTNFLDHTWVRQVSGVIDRQFFSARGDHLINDARTRGDDVHVVLATEPFLNDLHVKQPEKATAKSKSERDGAFRLIDKRRIVEAQLCDCRLQMLEVSRINRIDPTEDHGMNFLETWERLARGMALIGDGIPDFHVGSRFDVCDEITDIARV